MVTLSGSQIPLAEIEFDDLSKGFGSRWRFKAPSSLQQSIPHQEETVIISGKTAEAGLLSVGQEALLLQRQKAPMTTKLLELSYLAQGLFIHSALNLK